MRWTFTWATPAAVSHSVFASQRSQRWLALWVYLFNEPTVPQTIHERTRDSPSRRKRLDREKLLAMMG
jgi:hypothetical protein